MSNYWKKKLEELEGTNQSGSTTSKKTGADYWKQQIDELEAEQQKKPTTPVKPTVTTKKEDKEKKKGLFDGLLAPLDDGWDAGDIASIIMEGADRIGQSISRKKDAKEDKDGDGLREASWLDATVKSAKRGYYNSLYGEETFSEMLGKKSNADVYRKILEGDEYQFEAEGTVKKAISGAAELLGQQARQFTHPRTLATTGTAATMAAIAGQAGPQVLAPEEIITVPAAAIVGFKAGSAASNLEIEAGNAYNEMIENGISEETAKNIALAVGGVNAGLEFLQVDELFKAFKVLNKTGATDTVVKRITKELLARGVDVAKETAQEVAQEGVTIAGVQAASKKDKGELAYTKEDVASRLGETAMSSALSFGAMNVPAGVSNVGQIVSDNANAQKLTENEQKVVDKEVENRIAEQEKDGKKLTNKEKAKIYDQVIEDMAEGDISIDTIESVLAGEEFQPYKEMIDEETAIREELEGYQTEYENLSKKDTLTLEETVRKNELAKLYTDAKAKLDDADRIGKRDYLKANLDKEVYEMTKGSKLTESFYENVRAQQKFEADVTKYEGKGKALIQSAIDSDALDNTRKMHKFIDTLANIANDSGRDITVAKQDKLLDILEQQAKDEGRAFDRSRFDGKIIDGVRTQNGIILNPESKRALNFVAGHEITHTLEKSGHYKGLFDALMSYGAEEYQKRFDERAKQYEGIYADENYKDVIDMEVAADMVGDYLFTDYDFVSHLSAKHQNVFQKVWSEIKHLCKLATAGSKEARELEKVKRAFEQAYREGGKAQGDTKYSISDSDGKQLTKEQQNYFKDSKVRDENGNLKVMYHGSRDAGFHVFDSKFSDDDISFFFVDSNDVAASYSGTTEVYEAKSFNTAADANKFFEEIGRTEYRVVEKDGEYTLYDDGGEVATSDNLAEIYEEFCDYEGVGYGNANYKVYLNLTNPLVVDAEGRNWDNVSRDFSQEVYDRYQSLTAEEKDALTDLAGWEDFGTFRHEINQAMELVDMGREGGNLASAYEKLSAGDTVQVNMYDLFSIASDGFSEEALKEFAVKQFNTRDYAKRAKEQGYNGVIFKNIVDVGGYGNGNEGAGTVAIAFDSNQIKSVANDKPTADKDIRYSLSDAQSEYTTKSEVQFSLSNDTAYMDKAIVANNSYMTVDSNIMAEAKVLRERIAGRMNDIKDRGLVALPDDVEGNTYIANSSYDGTEENTTICPRSLASEAFVDAVSEYLGRPLTVEEQIYISQDLQGRTLTPECLYCYVATDRKAYRAFLGEWVKQRDAVIEKLKANPDADVSRSGELYNNFRNGRKDTDQMYNRFKMWVNAYKNGTPMIDGSHLANINKLMGDINSEFGAELKPQIVDAMKYAQSASWAKKRVNYVAYNGHILKWKQNRINKLNSHYGLRMYSFSDFHPAFVLENMQMITDASVRGLKMLGYTKDTDFVEIFAPTGMNINVSTFGFESGGQVFENNIIGANWDTAKALREQYPNVGVTFVATNDTLVEWALEQDWIDVVIPYHLVRTGAEVAKALNYTNYTSESSDTKTADWKKGNAKYIAPTEHNNDLETYLAALEKNNLNPRFERFLSNPNYMKLVNECRQPASESKPVQPIFNEDAAMKALAKLEANGYYQPIGGSVDRMYEIAAEVAESMAQEIAPAMSLSQNGEQFAPYGNWNVYNRYSTHGKDIRLETAPVQEAAPVSETTGKTNIPVSKTKISDMFPDDAYAPIADDPERFDSLTDEDAPPVMEAPYNEAQTDYVDDPFENRDYADVGKRNVKAYMYENPEVKPFFQTEAEGMLGDLMHSIKGEKWYNDAVYYESGGEFGWGGTKRHTTDDIAYLLDSGYTYAEIEKGLNAIIEDNGAENNAVSKRIEFALNDRLLNGYRDLEGRPIPPNEEYINLLNEKQINEYSKEAFDAFMANADSYAPPVEEDIAPVVQPVQTADAPVAEAYEAIRPKPEKQPKLAKATPAEQARAQVLTEEPKVDKKKPTAWSLFKDNFVDKGTVFETLSLKTGNRELQGRWKSIGRAESSAQWFMEHGNASTSSLKSIRETVENSGKSQQFYEYLYHLHNVDRMNLEDRYDDAENKPVFGYDVTSEMSKEEAAKLEAANPEFKEWSKEVYDYMTYLREMMVDDGVISRETANLWAEMYPHYVPIRRKGDEGLNINVALDTKRTGVNAPVKRATGGNRDILPLFDTMAMRTEQTFKAVARNRFGVELKNMLGTTIENEAVDIDEAIDSVETELLQEGKDGRNPTFTVFENGEKVTFEITDEMYNTMKPKSDAMSYTNKVLNTANNIRRGLLTEYNPAFMLTNPIKDFQDVLMNSQHPAKTYANLPKAIAELWNKSGQYYQEYMEHGGEQNTYFDGETKSFAEEKTGFKKVIGFPLEKISQANNFIERIPRMAEYIASRKMGRSIDVAMLDAARVTTDFSAGGDLVKMLNRNGFTFLNASVQGAVQQVRNVREAKAEGLKGWAKLATKVAVAGLPAMLLNHLLWDDDEDYEELSDYVKQNYYIVAKYGDGKFVRIPKGRALAVIQYGFKQMENLITGNDEVDLDAFAELVISNLAPNNPLDNNLIAPIMQAKSNKTWYGDDLVPTRLQDLPAAEQYDETTDNLSKWLGETLNISPYKINYLLDQYSGAVGDVFLPMMTPEAERGNDSLLGDMIAPISDKFTTDSTLKNQNVSDFYTKKEELTVKANASGATDEDVLMSKYMNSVNSDLAKLYAEKREIQNSNLPNAKKYAAVRDVQKQIVELTKEALNSYEDISYDGDYANIGNYYYQWYTPEEGDPYWRKLTEAQTTKYLVTKDAGNANYATNGTVHYRRDEDGKWTKISDKDLARQREVTRELGITPEEYWSETETSFIPMKKGEYEYAYENPGNYAVAKAVGGYDAYMGYSNDLYNIKADKDANGKSISGSRKEKVLDYINNLDADYYTRIILWKSEYPSDDSYNNEIIEYLNGRDDISFEETIAILRKLGFDVTDDGDISW